MKRIAFFQDLLLLKDGDLNSFIHHALLYSFYQVIVGNNHDNLSITLEKARNFNTDGVHENTSQKNICAGGPHAIDFRSITNEEEIELNLIF